jgi:hypothetical protein
MKRNALAFAALLAIAITAAIPPAAQATPEKSVSATPLEVTYYYLPT